MTLKKIIAVLTSASVIFTAFNSVTAADTELVSNITAVKSSMVRPAKEADMLWETFENGEEANWYFRNSTNSGNRKAEILSENGNKFMRYTVNGAWQTSYANSPADNANAIHPLLSRSFDEGAVVIDNTQYSVFEFDFRATQNNVANVWMCVNTPYEGEKMPDGTAFTKTENGLGDTGYRTRVHFTLESNKAGFPTKSNYANSAFRGQPSDNPYSGELSKNKWYRMRYVYNNPQKTVSVYLYDIENGSLLGTLSDKELSAWWYEYYNSSQTVKLPRNEIYDITIKYGGFGANEVDIEFDIDNLKIYAQKAVVKTQAVPNTDIGILYKPSELSLKFDGAVVIPDGSVVIKNESGDEIAHSGTYNEVTRTYTAVFGSVLPGGNYTVTLGADAKPLNSTEGAIISMGFESRELPVTVYDTMPPSAQNVVVNGRNIRGTMLVADYDYVSEAGNEGANSVYEWYVSENGTDGWTRVEGADFTELDVTESGVYGKYVKFRVKPVSDMGLEGQFYESNIIIPEAVPVADNVTLSATTLFPNSYITAEYDYSDVNGDTEGETEINWYTADSTDGEWSLAYTGEIYNIKDADMGKYIKCTVTPVADSVEEKRGAAVESEVAGPVADILESTNMLVDPGFESGELSPNWLWGTRTDLGGTWEGISIQDYDTHSGNYAVYMPARTIVNDWWGQKVAVTAGKTYLQGAWFKTSNNKLPAMQYLWPYMWDSGTRVDTGEQFYYTVTNRWQLLAGAFVAKADNSAVTVAPAAFEGLTSVTAHLDDMYWGELLVGDITTYEQEPVTIPASGTTSVTITNGIPLNQLGTQHGLWNDKAYVRIPEGTRGVTVDGNNIVVSDDAVAGTLQVEVYCEPTFSGASQTIFRKFVPVELVAGSDNKPKALDVVASGEYGVGKTLTGSYTYYQVEGKQDASKVRWMYSDSENGVYYDIPGTDGLASYVIESEYADKYIKFVVFPETTDGLTGTKTESLPVTKPRIPVAENLKITGEFTVGGEIKAEYTHHDPNGDEMAASSYEWLISDTLNGDFEVIPGENNDTIALTEDMIGKYIKFAVTPVSDTAPEAGVRTESDAVYGPAAPQARNVKISQDGSRLYATWFYYHPHGAEEGKSIYKWTADGVTLSTESDCPINFSGTKTITLTITPVSAKAPEIGTSVSLSVIAEGTGGTNTGGNTPVGGIVSGGGGFSGGGGGGGGGSSSGSGVGVTNINDMNLTDPNAEQEQAPEEQKPVSDISGHWGEEFILEMAERGVLSSDENGNYQPDEFVTREEMLTYLFKTLELEQTDYSGMFEDVADGEFAKMLQTMVDNGTIAKDIRFRPSDTISREEMCKILYISLDNANRLVKPEDMLISEFADYSSISEWARAYVNGIFANKIMVGVSDTEFNAQGAVTRAQAATMLVRILNLMKEAE